MSQRREAQQEEHKIDPQVQAMSKEEVKLFAAMVRACGEEEGQLADQSDEQVASSLLWLQDNGYISIEFDGEEIGIRLLDPPQLDRGGSS